MAEWDIKKFDSKNNICIQASAGTGKTFTVQQIVAELLRLSPARSLENILIVTYTEKAAGELRDRIRQKIQEVIETEDYNDSGDAKYLSVEEQKKNFKEQLSVVDNAPIFTIHSFCKKTLDEFGFTAKQCDNLAMIDEAEVSSFIEKYIRDEMAEDHVFQNLTNLSGDSNVINKTGYISAVGKYYLDANGKQVDDIIILDKVVDVTSPDLKRFTNKELFRILNAEKFDDLNFILNFVDKYANKTIVKEIDDNRPVDACKELEKRLEDVQLVEKAISDKQDLINDLIANGKNVPKVRYKELEDLKKYLEKIEHAKKTKNLSDLPGKANNTIMGSFLDLSNYLKEINDSLKIVKLGIETLKALFSNYIFQTHIPLIYKGWNSYKAENKFQSFDDMIRNVREAVCEDNSELKIQLKEKYNYAIIDEFQDTNQRQWDIFKHIFLEDDTHSICVVGDQKQSIYAFQGADVNVYMDAQEEIRLSNPVSVQQELPYNLENNYRSTNGIIDVCNKLFSDNGNSNFFKGNRFTFTKSYPPKIAKAVKPDATYCGKTISPIWIPENYETINKYTFASFAVEQVIKCCSYDKNGKTNLQIYKKTVKDNNGNYVLTDVNFGDFAVLCRSKGQMEELKDAFRRAGIPYNHYKESNLFNGKECHDWLAVFNAIVVEDFSSSNRKVLNECLFSSFFGKELKELSDAKYDKPDCEERTKIIQWKNLAAARKWSLLLENIFESTKVEERLSALEKLSSLTKLRQIGDYCVNYLYKNNCTVSELVNHLSLLAMKKGDSDEEDGNIVEKGTDFNSVQIMTMHASKGLEFPVVISSAGITKRKSGSDGVYYYHDVNERLHMTSYADFEVNTFNGTAMSASKKASEESHLEDMRLWYVTYTRATSLMILPWNADGTYGFLKETFELSDANNTNYREEVKANGTAKAKLLVKNILSHQQSLTVITENSDAEAVQKEKLVSLSSKMKTLDTSKLSYSNLSNGKGVVKGLKNSQQERNRESDGGNYSHFDPKVNHVLCDYDSNNLSIIDKRYPKGNLLGEAVHQIFEESDFYRVGNMASVQEAENDSALNILVNKKFRGQGFILDENDSKGIRKQTCDIVWNTFNAVFPEIQGNHQTGRKFSLKELQTNEHFAELEFNMNPEIEQNKEAMRNYFNGFIDLLFVRKSENGEKIYSVLDWKSNAKNSEDYGTAVELKKTTDEEYSIQRVLYSYCLIKWLKQFNQKADGTYKSESEIFDEQFGGIYYVYVRGCKAGTGNGIYAQTWNCWDDLKAAFDKIVLEKIPNGENNGGK